MKNVIKKFAAVGMAAAVAMSGSLSVFAQNDDIDNIITSVFGDNGASEGYTYTELEDNYDNSNGETWDEYVERVSGSSSSSSSSSSDTTSSSSSSSSSSTTSSSSSSSSSSTTSNSSSSSGSSTTSSSSSSSGSSTTSSSSSSGSSSSSSSSGSSTTSAATSVEVADTGNGTFAIDADEAVEEAGFSAENSVYTVNADGEVYFVTIDDAGEYCYIWKAGELLGAVCVVDENLVIVDFSDPDLVNIGEGTYLNFTSEEVAVYAAVMQETMEILRDECGYSGIAVNGVVLMTF